MCSKRRVSTAVAAIVDLVLCRRPVYLEKCLHVFQTSVANKCITYIWHAKQTLLPNQVVSSAKQFRTQNTELAREPGK